MPTKVVSHWIDPALTDALLPAMTAVLKAAVEVPEEHDDAVVLASSLITLDTTG